MRDLSPVLTPFWFAPVADNSQDPKVELRLRPLTQPQVAELFDTFATVERGGERLREPTTRTWYLAGCMGLDGGRDIRNLTIEGKEARWPQHRNVLPYGWIVEAGVRLCMDAWDSEEDHEKN